VPELRALGDGHLVACHFPLSSGRPPAAASEQTDAAGTPVVASKVAETS
jgi:hypothetical protein